MKDDHWWDGHTPRQVVDYCALRLGVTRERLLGPDRVGSLVKARRKAAFALREMGLSYPEIGHVIRRDHSTVQYLLKGKPRAQPVERVALANGVTVPGPYSGTGT